VQDNISLIPLLCFILHQLIWAGTRSNKLTSWSRVLAGPKHRQTPYLGLRSEPTRTFESSKFSRSFEMRGNVLLSASSAADFICLRSSAPRSGAPSYEVASAPRQCHVSPRRREPLLPRHSSTPSAPQPMASSIGSKLAYKISGDPNVNIFQK
jgi:hypothetical protein